jgi:tripartite-type tricarboxylate transporter receptor subunit TctC
MPKPCAFFVAVMLGNTAAQAAGYPERPVRFVIPFPPAGSSSLVSRQLAQKFSESFGQQFVIDNRTGAAGIIGHEITARAAADGYTIMLSGKAALTMSPHMYKRLPYDPLADYTPVSLAATSGQVLVVHPAVAAANVKELIALARAKPGQLSFGSGGLGTSSHISGEMFRMMTGADILHVPYKGIAVVVIDVVAGQIQMSFADLPPSIPQIKAGRLRALAVLGGQRSQALPEVPTMVEAGVPGYVSQLWWAVMVPKATPAAIVARLNAEMARIAKLPDVNEYYRGLGLIAAHNTPQQMTDMIRAEMAQMASVFKAAGIVPE